MLFHWFHNDDFSIVIDQLLMNTTLSGKRRGALDEYAKIEKQLA
jgi:hypothetical protein